MKIGKNYRDNLTDKDIMKKIREYLKKYKDFTFSTRIERAGWTTTFHITLMSGNKDITKNGTIEELNRVVGSINHYWLSEYDYKKRLYMSDELYNMLVDIRDYAMSFNYDDSDIMTDYFDTNFYLSMAISCDYINKSTMIARITEKSFVKTYKELWDKVNGAKMKMTRLNGKTSETGTLIVRGNDYYLLTESGWKIWGDKNNQMTVITENGFNKMFLGEVTGASYTFIE